LDGIVMDGGAVSWALCGRAHCTVAGCRSERRDMALAGRWLWRAQHQQPHVSTARALNEQWTLSKDSIMDFGWYLEVVDVDAEASVGTRTIVAKVGEARTWAQVAVRARHGGGAAGWAKSVRRVGRLRVRLSASARARLNARDAGPTAGHHQLVGGVQTARVPVRGCQGLIERSGHAVGPHLGIGPRSAHHQC